MKRKHKHRRYIHQEQKYARKHFFVKSHIQKRRISPFLLKNRQNTHATVFCFWVITPRYSRRVPARPKARSNDVRRALSDGVKRPLQGKQRDALALTSTVGGRKNANTVKKHTCHCLGVVAHGSRASSVAVPVLTSDFTSPACDAHCIPCLALYVSLTVSHCPLSVSLSWLAGVLCVKRGAGVKRYGWTR